MSVPDNCHMDTPCGNFTWLCAKKTSQVNAFCHGCEVGEGGTCECASWGMFVGEQLQLRGQKVKPTILRMNRMPCDRVSPQHDAYANIQGV